MTMIRNIMMWLMAAFALASCDGTFDGLYDDAVNDDHQQTGFNVDAASNTFTLTLDARDYDKWHYIDLRNKTIETVEVSTQLTGKWDGRSQWTYYSVHGKNYTKLDVRKVDAQREPADWDIAIHHFDAKTNGGGVLETQCSALAELPQTTDAFADALFTADEWSDNQCITDFSGMMAYNIWYTSSMVNKVLSRWVTMDYTTPPPVYSASGKVYVLRMKDGKYAALRMKDYMSDHGTKGFLTIEVRMYE